MNSNVNKKLNDVLSGLDKDKLNKAKRSVEEFLGSNEGQRIKENLKDVDKEKLINNFMNMDTEELRNTLKKANLSNLSGLDINSILKKLSREVR